MTVTKKNKIVLVAPGQARVQIGAVIHLPLALLSLAAWLHEKGGYKGRVTIMDTQIHRADPQMFAQAAVMGITAMTGSQIKYGIETAAMARRVNPEIIIVWGGIHPTLMPEQTLSHPLVDVVVLGEGEQTFLELVDAVFNGRSIAGIPGTLSVNSEGKVVQGKVRPFLSMDDLPLPAYDLIDINDYHGIEHQFDYQSSRGCPFRCGFCYNTVFCGRRYRKKSSAKVLQELFFLSEKYHVINFGLVDDEFFIHRKRVGEIFDGLAEKGDFGIVASCRLDIVQRFSPALMDRMKQAGVSQIFFGAESGSDRILKKIKKDITTEDIIKGAACTANNGIRPNLSFMSGFPGETLEDFKDTIDIILKLWNVHPLVTVNGIFPFNAYPGTDLYNKSMSMGFKAPLSLEEWGEWAFQYEPDNPWLDPVMKQWMEIAFYMVRFKYYIARFEDRYKPSPAVTLLKLITWPLVLSVKFRMKYRLFKMAWEWKAFAWIARRTFGFL